MTDVVVVVVEYIQRRRMKVVLWRSVVVQSGNSPTCSDNND